MSTEHSQPRYLITGAAGFIGSRVVESCQRQSIPVLSVDELQYFDRRPENQGLNFGRRIHLRNLWDELKNPELGPHSSTPISGIIHLGAISDTRETNQALLKELNLEYSQKLWNYATEQRIPFIYASSAATYGNGEFGYDDQESKIPSLVPLNDYGRSKQSFDLWVLEQERQGRTPPHWCGFKFFNVYGMGEGHKGFMSSVVRHAYDEIKKCGKVTLFKSHKPGIPDGFQKRDFIFVQDVVDVLHFALEKPIARGIFNLGTGQARSFLDLAQSVFQALGQAPTLEFIDTPEALRPKYQYFTQASMDRLKDEGWSRPFTDLEIGVKHYIHQLQEREIH
ncbi:MAG: ADP-glyceromanno-heptose 6-epimerase [Bdellovibrionia bacterium]